MIESAENKLTFVVGSERVFPFPIAFYDPGNIDCYIRIDDVERKLAEDEFKVEEKSDYSHGANITLLLDPLPTGATLAIMRKIAIEQTLSLPFNGKLPSKSLEQALDKLTMICQQQQEAIARSLTVGVTDTGFSAETLVESVQQSAQDALLNAQKSVESAADAAGQAVQAAVSSNNALTAANAANHYKAEANAAALKATGIPIGSVYTCLGQLPPDGAFLLNGQTIENCREEYPEFWQWLTGGEAAGIPVYKEFTMPTLTENGTPGGKQYAVQDLTFNSSLAYRIFSGEKNALPPEWEERPEVISLIFYSPGTLKVDHIVLEPARVGGSTKSLERCSITAGIDGINWESLAEYEYNTSISQETATIAIPQSAKVYNYFQFDFVLRDVNYGDYRIPYITLYGAEYLYTGTGGCSAPQLTVEDYNRQIALHGVCGGVVIDEDTGSVRLPTWKFQAQLPNTLQARGNGTALGVTDGSKQMGLEMTSTALHAYESLYASAAGTVPGTKTGGANALALTSDATKSGVVTDVVSAEADMFSWVIQVYNAPIPLSTQQAYAMTAIMQGKAQRDLGNAADNLDFIVRHEDLADGSWYDRYRSGKVIQGGVTAPVTASVATDVVVTMPIELANTDYQVWISLDGEDTLATAGGAPGFYATVKINVQSFKTKAIGTAGLRKKYWLAVGKAAVATEE